MQIFIYFYDLRLGFNDAPLTGFIVLEWTCFFYSSKLQTVKLIWLTYSVINTSICGRHEIEEYMDGMK